MATRSILKSGVTNPSATPITKQPADLNNDFVPVTTNSLTMGSDGAPVSVVHMLPTTTTQLPNGITALGDQTAVRSKNGPNSVSNNQTGNVVIGHGNTMTVEKCDSDFHSQTVMIGAKCENTGPGPCTVIGYAVKQNINGGDFNWTQSNFGIGSKTGNQSPVYNFNCHVGYGCQTSVGGGSGVNFVAGYKAKSTTRDMVIGAFSQGARAENRTSGIIGSQTNCSYGSANAIGHKIVNGSSFFMPQRYCIVVGNQANMSVGTASNWGSIGLGYKAVCNGYNQLAINVSGTTTNSLRTTLTVSTQGTGLQANPGTTKVLPVKIQNTNYKIQLFT